MGGAPSPYELPRQRRGTTPQMHGRYPDYDVLENARHWDPVTRELVIQRVENVPPVRFFSAREAATARALCDVLMAQDRDPRIPVVNYVDEKLHEGQLDGYQYFDMPDDRDVWRIVLRGLDEQAAARADAEAFAAATHPGMTRAFHHTARRPSAGRAPRSWSALPGIMGGEGLGWI